MVTVHSATLVGITACPVTVRTVPNTTPTLAPVLGDLPATHITELRTRVLATLRTAGYAVPQQTAVVIEGYVRGAPTAQLDLPVALALVAAASQQGARVGGDAVAPTQLAAAVERTLAVGELSLTGQLRPIRGTASYAEAARARTLACPLVNAAEALTMDVAPCAADSFDRVVTAVTLNIPLRTRLGASVIPTSPPKAQPPPADDLERDLIAAVNAGAKRVLIVGEHSTRLHASTEYMAQRLPPWTADEQRLAHKVWSAAGLADHRKVSDRPIRRPYPTLSETALFGGGRRHTPGELALATHGVLVLEHVHTMPPQQRRLLAAALDEHEVRISVRSATGTTLAIRLPAAPALVVGTVPDAAAALRLPDGLFDTVM